MMNPYGALAWWQWVGVLAVAAWHSARVQGLALLLAICACGAPVEQLCPSVPSHEAPCCESEVGAQLCVAGQAWVCEPNSFPCYDYEAVGGNCPTAPDGGELHPELVNRRVWYENGSCAER